MKGNYKLSTSQTDLDNDTNTLFEIRCDMYVTHVSIYLKYLDLNF